MSQAHQSQEPLSGTVTESAEAVAPTGLSGRELDAAIAEKVMRFTRAPEPSHPTDNRAINGVLYYLPDTPWDRNQHNVVPYFSSDIAAAMEVESRIAEISPLCKLVYLDALRDLLESERDASLWNLIHATAEQRCRAALEAVRKEI